MIKPVIYVDILLCVNLIINYFILLATSRIMHLQTKRLRIFFGALLGATYSFYIFIPQANVIISYLVKFIMSCTIIPIAFKVNSCKLFFKLTACFYLMSFAFCGVIFLIWLFISPHHMMVQNSIVYFNISPIIFIMSTLISYIIIRLANKLSGREMPKEIFCEVIVESKKNIQRFRAKIDTGNNLIEPFSGDPVIVTEKKYILNFLKENPHIRLVPFNCVSNSGLLQAFKPDKTTVIINKKALNKNAYIAFTEDCISSTDFHAIVGLDLIS